MFQFFPHRQQDINCWNFGSWVAVDVNPAQCRGRSALRGEAEVAFMCRTRLIKFDEIVDRMFCRDLKTFTRNCKQNLHETCQNADNQKLRRLGNQMQKSVIHPTGLRNVKQLIPCIGRKQAKMILRRMSKLFLVFTFSRQVLNSQDGIKIHSSC